MTRILRSCVGLVTAAGLSGCLGFPFPPGFGGGGSDFGGLNGESYGSGLAGCNAVNPETTGTVQGDLVGTWQDWGGTYNLVTFDNKGTVTYAKLPQGKYGSADFTAEPAVDATGTYTVKDKTVTVTWNDGTTESNTAEVENVPGCTMLSFTQRGTRLTTDGYFERVSCPESAAAPASGAAVTPASTTPVTR